MTKKQLGCALLLSINLSVAAAEKDPCAGPNALLNLSNRPTVADSPCVVPFKNALLELGYQYQKLSQNAGDENNFPEAEFRIGIPANNEISVEFPNYIYHSKAPHSGFTSATFKFKHEIGYNDHWIGAAEALFTPPIGSNAFGNEALGAALNGIVNYTFNSQFSISLMLGVSTQTQSQREGGERFTSINPDFVFIYAPYQKINFYAEVYGQSKVAPREGSGFNADAGIVYLLVPRWSVDLEFGQRISGHLGGFDHYVGMGTSVLF